MYSGIMLTKYSGRLLGTHQKIDRAARTNLEHLLKNPAAFPSNKNILMFEGLGGPDAIKIKSPAHNEPWHFVDPFNENDTQLFGILRYHYEELVSSLKKKDTVRASFEAAWLAHALVDGLTPAHHYPYEEKLSELRGGEGNETRSSVKKKIFMPGDTRREQLTNNWKMWGAHGLYTTHTLFEMGVTTIISAMRLRRKTPSAQDILEMQSLPLTDWFLREAQQIFALKLYEDFYKHGWRVSLARKVRTQLVPLIVQAVTLVWYRAAAEAGMAH